LDLILLSFALRMRLLARFKHWFARVTASCALLLAWVFCAQGAPLDQWIWRNPQPFAPQLQSVTHGAGLWLVFGNVGSCATSPDGITWDVALLGTNSASITGAYGNGRYVAGTSRGELYSADGHTWTAAVSGGNLNDLCFGNGQFVGVTAGNTAWRSTDGNNWSSVSLGAIVQLSRISFANEKFFAMGVEGSTQEIYSSTNGANWTGPTGLGTNGIQRLAFGNGWYASVNPVIAGSTLYTEFRTSLDGATWSAPTILSNTYATDILFANGQFTALDEIGGILFSTSGTTWSEQLAPELFGLTRIDFDGSLYVVTGLRGIISTSPDAHTWTRRTTGPLNTLACITRASGQFLAAGGNLNDSYSVSTVMTSPDGRSWTEHNSGTTNTLLSLAFGNGRYVGVGVNGTIVSSTDSSTWNAVSSPTTNPLYSVTFAAGQFVAVGGTNRATILNSPDGLLWSTQTTATNYYPLYALVYAQGQFLAVGQTNGIKQATVLTSADGLTWTPRLSSASNTLRSVCFGNGAFLAAGDSGTATFSVDGVNWTNASTAGVLSWRGAAYGAGQYVLISSSPPTHAASTNGINWTLSSAMRNATLQPLYGIVTGAYSFFVAGYEGQILESLPFNPAPPQINLGLKQSGQSFLSFTAPEFHAYEIQAADSFASGWQPIAIITNASATTTVPLGLGTNGPARFYRARLVN
jgi:hypothetical protein